MGRKPKNLAWLMINAVQDKVFRRPTGETYQVCGYAGNETTCQFLVRYHTGQERYVGAEHLRDRPASPAQTRKYFHSLKVYAISDFKPEPVQPAHKV